MIVVDSHQDIAWNAVAYQRDYRLSALKKRQLEATAPTPNRRGSATLGLPEALAGRVALVFATIFVAPYSEQEPEWAHVSYTDADGAYRLASQQLDYYQRLTDEDERLSLIRTAADLEAVLATWQPDMAITERKQGLVILMEGADPIIEPQQFEEWHERGVRLVGPAWQGTRYSGGTGQPGPLTTLGFELLEIMAGFNAVLDLSHLAERACLQALDAYEGPVIASHSNPRYFCNTDRHLPDEIIRRLAERDGVMGVVMANKFLDGGWRPADGKRGVTITRVVEIIDYVCQLTGSAAHVGLGSDFDGGFGTEAIPAEFDTVADLWQIGEALQTRGYEQADTSAILGANMLRPLRQCLAGTG
jgi:membrane dipeptidase